ncbi:PD-(D/E)XK motif protein [Providencia rettgeri]|nr:MULTISPECIES: PD-(D/E)XK motif protein [Providencia]MCX9124525.1 PD-(D/E)XK motif protein [Providencia rettgeri]MCX9128113.1 PD-(D/E)XK motif protein [Providencia rettgeri]UPQ39065.1 PD-(D/E)XK motif protein [Providencia rettgeri]
MMMSKSTPWDSIPNLGINFSILRVKGNTGFDIYWGKDSNARCLLIIELSGDHTEQFRQNTVSLHGITIALHSGSVVAQQRLIITLAQHVDSDLFLGLCNTLIQNLQDVTDSATALTVVLTHLKRWRAFLANRYTKLLSFEEIQGLFGELYILRKLYKETLSQLEAVNSWSGINNSHHDFIFGNRAFEVKSLSGRERSSVRISSEDQLESLTNELFLLIVHLNNMPDSDGMLSLNKMVSMIASELTDPESIELFYSKLASISYAPLTEYDSPCFTVKSYQGYRVSDQFPRLIRSTLPSGITKLSYDLKLESIAPFLCDKTDMFVGAV